MLGHMLPLGHWWGQQLLRYLNQSYWCSFCWARPLGEMSGIMEEFVLCLCWFLHLVSSNLLLWKMVLKKIENHAHRIVWVMPNFTNWRLLTAHSLSKKYGHLCFPPAGFCWKCTGMLPLFRLFCAMQPYWTLKKVNSFELTHNTTVLFFSFVFCFPLSFKVALVETLLLFGVPFPLICVRSFQLGIYS